MKKKLLMLLTLVFFIPFVINAEELKMDWQRNWGGNSSEQYSGIIQTEDGGFLAYGYSYSTDIEDLPNKGDRDAIIVKCDKDGNLMWQKSWGGNNEDRFYELLQTKDGGFIAYGYSSSTDIEGLPNKGDKDAIIVKYDKDGNMMWQKSWGGNGNDDFSRLLQTEDGVFIVYGGTNSTDMEELQNKGYYDAIIVKYDKNGNLMWQKSWGGNGNDYFYEFLQKEDSGFIAYGCSFSTDIEGLPNKGNNDAIIVKYDKDGNLMWQKSWGGNGSEYFSFAFQMDDKNFIVYGGTTSTDVEGLPNKGENDVIIVNYDKDGNMLWKNGWGGNYRDYFNGVLQTEDGEFIAYGNSASTDIEGLPNKGSRDAIIVKYDKDGNLMWQKSWGGNKPEEFFNVLQTEDGDFIAYGTSSSTDIEGLPNKSNNDVIIVKYDKDGNLMWQKSWGGNGNDAFSGLLQTEDDSFIAYGYSNSQNIEGLPNKGSVDAIMAKYSIEYNLENITSQNGTSTVIQQGKYGIITPTPNEDYEVDKIIIKDKDGNVLDVEATKQEDGTYSFELYTDVSVEVLFKEKIENPKTGIMDFITIIFVGLFISLSGFYIVKRYNERLEF